MHGYSAFELRPKGRREAMSRVSSDCSRTLPQALSDSHDQSRIGWYLSAYRVVAPPFTWRQARPSGQVLPDQADKQANRPPVDWAPPPWANRPTDEPPSDPGSIPGRAPPPWTAGPDAPAAWAPPPWSPDAAATRPSGDGSRPSGWIAGALVLVGAAVGWQFIGFITTRTEAPNVRVTAT